MSVGLGLNVKVGLTFLKTVLIQISCWVLAGGGTERRVPERMGRTTARLRARAQRCWSSTGEGRGTTLRRRSGRGGARDRNGGAGGCVSAYGFASYWEGVTK